MKTKLISLIYRGNASVDPRFSASMLPWTMNDIRSLENTTKLSVVIENGILETYNSDFELQFTQNLKHIVGMCRIVQRNGRTGTGYVQIKSNGLKSLGSSLSSTTSENSNTNLMEFSGPFSGMVYLLKDPRDPLLHIHLYESDFLDEMTELMQQMRHPSHSIGGSDGSIPQTLVASSGSGNDSTMQKGFRANGLQSTPATNLKLSEAVRNAQHDPSPNLISSKMSASKSYTYGLSNSAGTVNVPSNTSTSANLSLLGDISPNHTHFFEVLYVGKIRVSHKRVPFTFIDDALPKFKAYDVQRNRINQSRKASLISEGSIDNMSNISKEDQEDDDASDECSIKSENQELKIVEENGSGSEGKSEFKTPIVKIEENKENKSPKRLQRGQSHILLPVKKDIPKPRDRSASYGCIPPYVEQNRTMVFLVGRSDLRLISPDRKQVLLYKDFKDVASCAQGHKNSDHFGIICREGQNEGYIGYVFKCQSDHVSDDIVQAISQAFITCSEQKKKASQIFSCEHCPMLWYHKLCTDIDGLSDKKTQSLIFRRIESLSDDEQDIIWAKYYGAEKINRNSHGEQNQFLMMLLRAHCESRQQRHVHDTAENRSEFLNQYLGGSTIFMKAKRSLTSSFDHLLKRKASRDDINISSQSNLITKDGKENLSEGSISGGEGAGSEGYRSRSNTLGSSPTKPNVEPLKSPMMDIFIKVGNSPKESSTHQGSWRQAILNSVVTPSKILEHRADGEFLSPLRKIQPNRGKRTKEELRELWQTAIRQTILLSRMEKENAKLQDEQNENEFKKIKLDYDTIIPCDRQLVERWEMIIERDANKITNKRDPKVLMQAIKNGVPRAKRGDVWSFLAEQHSMHTAPVDTNKFPNFNTPYHILLKSLTEHQHAIFIDLGRTFPNHKFYKDPLGVGQLSLFNLLKAYSILDPELGYCQGLGFICGVLLLHCEEAEAFELLKHLMFRRKMRTKYLPDMKKFQLQLYQLSRLVKDHLPDLYEWLNKNDVSPTLYAAPWILTVFSSQFPLGFVVRIFDLLFLESSEVIFKFAIALLSVHKTELLARDSFEDVMDYLKTVLPKVEQKSMEKVLKLVFSMDISIQLTEYQVEYNVLQEELTTTNRHLELLNRANNQNQHLETQLQFAQSSIAQLEKTRTSQQTQITTLQSQVQTLELTIHTLGQFVAQVVERNTNLDLPSDVRRILQQLDDMEKQRRKPIFLDRKIGKSMSVNSNLGLPMKILEELNEREEGSPIKKKTPFFENTYEQLRQKRTINQRPKRLIDQTNDAIVSMPEIKDLKVPERLEKVVANIKTPVEVDSGVCTPLSPTHGEKTPNDICDKTIITKTNEMHPLSMCGDVSVRFNGTTQLKSIRSSNPRQVNQNNKAPLTQTSTTTIATKSGRS